MKNKGRKQDRLEKRDNGGPNSRVGRGRWFARLWVLVGAGGVQYSSTELPN